MGSGEIQLRGDYSLGGPERHVALAARRYRAHRPHQETGHALSRRLHRARLEIDEQAVDAGAYVGEQTACESRILRQFRVHELARDQKELRIRERPRFRARAGFGEQGRQTERLSVPRSSITFSPPLPLLKATATRPYTTTKKPSQVSPGFRMTLPRLAETAMAASAMCWSLKGCTAENSGTRSRNPATVLLRESGSCMRGSHTAILALFS